MTTRLRKPRRPRRRAIGVGSSVAVPLTKLMEIGQVRALVEREAQDGFAAAKSATCRVRKTHLRWEIAFRKKTAEGRHVRTLSFNVPFDAGAD